jgi:LPPG:FO 2-phospho-L-lactate transferase
MLRGLVSVVDPASVTAVVNTGDDTVMHGLHISPDLDTVTYTLAGMINPDTGWGLAGETWSAMEQLRAYSNGRLGWFNLGDKDLGTHLYRTTRLR